MEHQSFSHGLLYSVAPENFSNLHLRDDADVEELDWQEEDSRNEGGSLLQTLLAFFKTGTAKR